MKLSIVIPVYNEVNTLLNILSRVQEAPLPDNMEKEIIIVDDYSTDGTRDLLDKIQKENYKIIYHNNNMGKGAALKTGFAQCSGDIVIIQDADLEYDPNEYTKLIQPILSGKANVVYGSRFAGGETHRVLYYWHSLANRLLTWLSNIFSDLNLTDMETCYKVFTKQVIERIDIEEKRFGIEPEITAKVSKMAREEDISIYEVGISYYGRTYNEGKKIGFKDAFRALWCIFKYNTSKLANFAKYGFNGLIVAASQFATIIFLVEYLHFSSKFQQNVAYAISIEVSIIIGFLLHAFITWRYKFRSVINFVNRMLLFHLVTAVSFLIRQVLFYILLEWGVNYRANTLIGIIIAVIINFFGYQNIVFKEKISKQATYKT